MAFTILFLTVILPMAMAQMKGSLDEVTKGNNLFANNMYHELAKTPGNVFFSPLSAHTILALVAQGAAGDTLKEFNKVLSVGKKSSSDGYQKLMQKFNSVQNITLHMANKIYIKEGYKLKANFKTVASNTFLTEVESINFLEKLSAVANINRWCLKKTNNKIRDVVKPDDLNENTRLILLNAIYFKGDWHYKFNKTNTKKSRFYLIPRKTINVDMMSMTQYFNYVQDQDFGAQFLEIPYKNKDFSMVIVLPDEKNGIDKVEQKLVTVGLERILSSMVQKHVIVQLPKFKIETEMPLTDVLKKMGLVKAFGDADFTQLIDSKEKIVISQAIQKAFIEVNEEGAEAAAVTAMHMHFLSALTVDKPKEIRFIANRPFIFAIQMKSGSRRTTLFMGKIVRPIWKD